MEKSDTDKPRLQTNLFRMGGMRFARELIFRYAAAWLLALSMLAVVGLAFGVAVDLRWMVVALMLVFVVIPMVLAVCYYYFGLRRECYVNAFPHTLEITPEGITATMHFKSRRPAGENPADEMETEPEEKIVTEFFPSEMLGDIRLGPSSFTLPVTSRGEKAEGMGKHRSAGFIWIPVEAFDCEEDYAAAVDMLNKKLRK